MLDVLKKYKSPKVHLIAHSMGGLDARHLLYRDRKAGTIHMLRAFP